MPTSHSEEFFAQGCQQYREALLVLLATGALDTSHVTPIPQEFFDSIQQEGDRLYQELLNRKEEI